MSTVQGTVEGRLRHLLAARLGIDVPDPDLDLIGGGVIDSLALVEMLFEIENEFAVRIELDQIDLDRFRTLHSIAAWLHEEASRGA